MSNPFDEVIDGEKKYEKHKHSEGHEDKKEDRDNIDVSFSVNKRWLERLVWLIIVLVELYFILVQPLDIKLGNQEPVAQEQVQDTQVMEPTTNQSEENKTEVTTQTPEEPPEEVTTKVEEKEESPEESDDLPYEGNFVFKLNTIDFDENDDGAPSKMNSITILMVNNWKTFRPRIVIYWYDESSGNVIRSKVRADRTLLKMSKGVSQKITIDQFDSSYFDPQNAAETVKAELYDYETGEYLDKSVTIIS